VGQPASCPFGKPNRRTNGESRGNGCAVLSRVGVAVLNAHGLPFLAAKWRTLAESDFLAGVAVAPTTLAYRLILSYTVRVTVSAETKPKPISFGSHPSGNVPTHGEPILMGFSFGSSTTLLRGQVMLSQKLFLPMSNDTWKTYAVTLKEQQDLARKFGLSVDQVRFEIGRLKNLMDAGVVLPQNTANKTAKIINAHFESSNATERQGA
jgi:hypothetical protein